MKVFIYALTDVYYYSYYIQGFYEVFGRKNVIFSTTGFPDFGIKSCAIILEDKRFNKKIIIDAYDGDSIREKWLDWCDVYAKVNINLKKNYSKKVLNIGPSFGIQIWNLFETLKYCTSNLIKGRLSAKSRKEFIAGYWRQYKRRRLEEYLKRQPIEPGYVFFISSIWAKEKRTNASRAAFIQACSGLSQVNFEGGFAPRKDGNNYGLSTLAPRVTLTNYIDKLRKAELVFNTPAVLDCHGWKLAEFLALGKAIISTSHFNALPKPLKHGEHLHYIQDNGEIESAVLSIINDPVYRVRLEKNAHNYFVNVLQPATVVKKLISY